MNMELKAAWYQLSVIIATLLASLIGGILAGFPGAFSGTALFGFIGLTPALFRKSQMDCDERDLEVAKTAALFGGMASCLAICAGGMGIWCLHYFGGKEFVRIDVLPALVMSAAIVLFLVRSLCIVLHYTPRALGIDE